MTLRKIMWCYVYIICFQNIGAGFVEELWKWLQLPRLPHLRQWSQKSEKTRNLWVNFWWLDGKLHGLFSSVMFWSFFNSILSIPKYPEFELWVPATSWLRQTVSLGDAIPWHLSGRPGDILGTMRFVRCFFKTWITWFELGVASAVISVWWGTISMGREAHGNQGGKVLWVASWASASGGVYQGI